MTSEWESKDRVSDEYGLHVHKPCGTEVWVLMGCAAICPKCQPEEWAEQKKREGL